MSTERTKLEQGRAAFAYECAEQAKQCHDRVDSFDYFPNQYFKASNYSSYVKNLPMLIKVNGLGSAFAFVRSKGAKVKKERGRVITPGERDNPKNAYDLLYEQIAHWIKTQKEYLLIPTDGQISTDDDFVKQVINLDSAPYRTLTIEILALINWLKRFSVALLGDGENE